MAELVPNYGSFVVKGVVGGLERDRFYDEGSTEKGKWHSINFSVKFNDNAAVYVNLVGFKGKTVLFTHEEDRSKKIDVPWADRYKERKDGYRMANVVKVGLTKDENSNKNKVISLTQYDAVDYIKKYLKNGDSVYIRGQLEISSYNGKPQESFRIQQIYHTSEPVDFTAEGYEPEASFSHEIVYVGSEYDEQTNRTAINTYIIYRDRDKNITFTPYMFFINHEKYKNDEKRSTALEKLKNSFENLPFGSTIRVNGNINVYVEKAKDENEEMDELDFGGFTAKGQETYTQGSTIRELEITGGDGRTLITERYSEDDFLPKDSPFSEDNSGFPVELDEDNLPF